MRVLLSAFQCYPGRGSEMGNGWRWAIALSELGHEVTVITSSEFREPVRAADSRDVQFRFVDIPAPRLSRLPSRLQVYTGYMRFQDAALAHLQARPQQYDLAHHVAWGSLHMGSRLWRLPMPLLYGPIGGGQTAPSSYWRYFGKDWPGESLRTAATGTLLQVNRRSRETIRNSAVTLVTNSATAAACRRLGATDVRYMLAEGLPADWVVEPRQRPPGTPVVLWVGRLLARKAPILALEAFAELRRTTPARLVMAGDGPLRGQVRAAVGRLGLAADVDLLGTVPWDTVRELCDSASAFLFTSLRDSSGSQFLEALGRGLPAVALDHHGIGDTDTGSAAIKVALSARPQELPGALGRALRTVLTDDQWEMRSAAGVKWAAEHVWAAKAQAASQIYREIVTG
jgi:glycosyltransferase involved in cell wall biosynthesis